MPKPLIPPHYVNVNSRLLFRADMPAPVLVTLMQLIALAWDSHKGMTCPLTYRDLANLTSKSVRTIYGHLSALQNTYAALRLQRTGDGIFVVVLAGWVLVELSKSGETDCKSLQTPIKEEELTINDSEENLLLNSSFKEEEYEEKPQKIAKYCKKKPLRKSLRVLSPNLREKLLTANVFPGLLNEVAASHYSEEDLLALLAWCTPDQPDNPAPLLIGRLRVFSTPPDIYRQPPCPRCGRYGGNHADDCSARYTSGPYAEFLEN
jgi:hypothetical protein